MMPELKPYLSAALIVQDAGGELVGRTRLQKIAFLLKLAGYEVNFPFEYHHFGPYSEGLSEAMEIAVALGPVKEEERSADWGGRYSIYKLDREVAPPDLGRSAFVQKAKAIDAIE